MNNIGDKIDSLYERYRVIRFLVKVLGEIPSEVFTCLVIVAWVCMMVFLPLYIFLLFLFAIIGILVCVALTMVIMWLVQLWRETE